MDDDELAAAEEARDRRRDRRTQAHGRDLMRTGSAKVFKQILDVQEKRARADGEADEQADDERDDAAGSDGGPRHGRHRHHGHGDDRDR